MAVALEDDARLTGQLRRAGYAAIAGVGLVAAILIAYGLTSEIPWVGLIIPVSAAGALLLALAAPSRTTAFAAMAGGSAILLVGGDGFSALEVLYGLGAMAYLAVWIGHACVARVGVLRSSTDVAAAAWCAFGIVGGAALGVLFGGDAYDFRADLQAALFFPFYFPIKEVVRRAERGPVVVLGLFLALGLFAAVYNAFSLRAQLAAATAIYEVVDIRVAGGMMQVSAAVLIALSILSTPQRRVIQLVVLGSLAALLIGLVTGKSRAYWVAVALGVGIIGVLARGGDRRRLAGFLVVGVAGVVILAVAIVGDQLLLIAAGALDRLTSLTGASSDISLVNRLVETRAALDRIAQNPILGHGWGTQITYYSIVGYGTTHWAFMHNGYVALWFKLGLWGLALMTFVWISTLVRGAWTALFQSLPAGERALLVGSVATLSVFALTAFTSNPFSIMDQMLTVALLLGAASGVVQRAQDRAAQERS